MKFLLPLAFVSLVVDASAVRLTNDNFSSGINPKNLDKSVKPGTDFYNYACGGWRKNNPLPPEYSSYGSFNGLIENNEKQIRGLITELAEVPQKKGSLKQKIADMYNSVMDTAKQNREGITPVMSRLQAIRNIKDKKALFDYTASAYNDGELCMFGFYISADMHDSNMNLVHVCQSGLTLGQKEYYLDTDDATKHIRDEYKKYIVDLFKLYGATDAEANKAMEDVMRIETRIADKSYSRTELRDPQANYHKISYDELLKDYADIDWNTFFKYFGLNDIKTLNLQQPEPIREVGKIWKDESLESLKNYCLWTVIDYAAPYLSDTLRARHFAFYGKVMSGQEQQKQLWRRAVSAVNGGLGQAVGRLYTQKYFPEASKQRMLTLVKNLQIALGQRIREQEWMSDETKARAIEKLDAFRVKIGYPDKWLDYSDLEIGDSYLENMVNCSHFAIADMIRRKYNKPVDRDEWHMDPQTVNAYYNPTTNEICFPAGILQYPFFDMSADDAFNYGAIGVVIGHEMTHGFDDQGRQFDKDGNFNNWWKDEDSKRFEERANEMEAFFNKIEVLPGLNANGQLTLGENLADHGGLMVAYQAFCNATKDAPLENKDGFTPAQRFFLAYANLWANNIRDEEVRRLTKLDPHSLAEWRVNGALPHIDAWYEAFGITEKDPLFIPKDKRVSIW